ncbi:MAG: hypothetical protein WA691_03635 [Thermoplasmata archaeon]
MRMPFGQIFAEHPDHQFSPISKPVRIGERVVYSGTMLRADHPILGRRICDLAGRDLEVENVVVVDGEPPTEVHAFAVASVY